MKRLFKMVSLCALTIFLLAGCAMKSDYNITVGKDKKVTLEFVVAYDDEMIDGFMSMDSTDSDDATTTTEHTDQERWAFLEKDSSEDKYKDFKKEKYDKDGFKGYKYILEAGSIDDLVADGNNKIDIDNMTDSKKIFTKDGDTYKLNIKVSDDSQSQMEQYANSIKFDAKINVKLPNKAKSNNATTVDGTTYTWDLSKTKEIELSFDLNGSSNLIWIIIGVAAVVVIAVAACLLLKKNNTKKVGE